LGGEDRAKYLFLWLLQARIGSSLVKHLGDLAPEAVLRTPVVELAGRAKISPKASRAFEELQRVFDPDRLQDRLAAKGLEALTPVDEAYPNQLRSIPDPPPALFVNGAIPETVSVALVGSRKASATGIETARALGLALSERGVCVVSGLALGVDAAAHEGAVAAGGVTVGVLGCGIDIIYPRRNRGLFESVRRHGALISEYYLGEAPLAWRFPARNRIIAGLAGTVVVVEAPEQSGALITARHALDAGRDVWAVPGPRASASAGARTGCSPTAPTFFGIYQSSSTPWRGRSGTLRGASLPETPSPCLPDWRIRRPPCSPESASNRGAWTWLRSAAGSRWPRCSPRSPYSS